MPPAPDDTLAALATTDAETPENDPQPAGGRARAQSAATPPAKEEPKPAEAAAATAPSAAAESVTEKPAAKAEPVVPVARLTAERRHFQDELKKRDGTITDLETRLKALEKPPAKEPEPPDYLDDPKGYVDAIAARADQSEKVKILERQIADEKQAREQLVLQQQAQSAIRSHEADFATKTPDYYEALEHGRGVRRQQLKIDYPEAEDTAIEGELARQELAYAFGMIQRGANPAERAYQYAKTLGYTPKQAAAAAKADGGTQGAATQERTEEGKFKKPDAAEMEAAASLGSSGGESAAEEADLTEKDMFDLARAERFGKRA